MAEEEGKSSKTTRTRTTTSKPSSSSSKPKKSKSTDGSPSSSKKTRPTTRRSKSPKSSSRSKSKREKSPKSPKTTKTSKSKSNEKASSSKSKSVVDHTSTTTTQSAKENNPNIIVTTTTTTSTATTTTTTNSNSNNLDPTEAEQLQEAFKMFDINGDGKIDKHELKISLEEMGQNHTKKQILQMIHSVDRDGNGKIDFDEFIDYMKPKVSETMNESELREAFAFWDSDGNGYISRGELKSAMRKMGEWLSEKEIDNMMDKVDKNGDGKVNFKEFRVMMMSSY